MAETKDVKVGQRGTCRGKGCEVVSVDGGKLVVRFDEEVVGQTYASGVARAPVVDVSRAPDAVVVASEFQADVAPEPVPAERSGRKPSREALTAGEEDTAAGMRGDLEKMGVRSGRK